MSKDTKASNDATNERDKRIKDILKKPAGKRTESDKFVLNRDMKERAKENASLPRNLDELMPSQMTEEEMKKYCADNKIEIGKDDVPFVIRKKIRGFRDPSQAYREADLAGKRI